MSGPKVIDYQAVERQRAEAARRRWLALCGRAAALSQQCAQAGHPQCAVLAGAPAGPSSTELEAACAELERALTAAADELARRRFADRTREVASSLETVLAELERRERQSAAEPAPRQQRQDSIEPRVDYAEKVSRHLASLQVPSTELQQAAKAVLAEADPTRSRLLYDDLKQRIGQANAAAEARAEQLVEIAELRGQLGTLADSDPLRVLLDHAERAVGSGDDATLAIRQARTAITDQLDVAAAAADREYVRNAVAESLTELGYAVADVELVTPETLVFQQDRTYGVQADVRDGQIDLRTVRLGSSTGASSDRDADEEFCARLPQILAALGDRGVSTRVTKDELPGLYAPETVPLKAKRRPGTAHVEQEATVARKHTAR